MMSESLNFKTSSMRRHQVPLLVTTDLRSSPEVLKPTGTSRNKLSCSVFSGVASHRIDSNRLPAAEVKRLLDQRLFLP